MKTRHPFQKIVPLIALLNVLIIAACQKNAGPTQDSNVEYYTCTMHPSVKSKAPGKCPICSMDLVPVMKKGGAGPQHEHGDMQAMKEGEKKEEEKPSEFVVPVERQQQIGVTYAKVERKPLRHTIRAVGLIAPDKGRNWQFVSRVDGYVQKLHVTAPGEIVEKDAPLLSIYSPDLLTSEREFVELLRMRDEAKTKEAREMPERLIESAKRRLQLWNVTEQQIVDLEKTRQASETLTLLSPFRGIVQSVPVDQGKNVKVGDMLVEVADLSLVWMWAEFYENELSMLKAGQTFAITAKSYPGEKFEGALSLINPFLDEMKRTAKVRIDIPNPDFKLRPGMYVNAELGMDMGEGLTVPVSAIMPTGTRNVVFVDKGEGKLEPRILELGSKYGDIYEVRSGVEEGERVVASGNFLIDAETKVQGAFKAFEEPEREAPRRPHTTQAAEQSTSQAADAARLPGQAQALFEPSIKTYLAIHEELAHDRFARVAELAAQLRQQLTAITNSGIKPDRQAQLYLQRLKALMDALGNFKPASMEEARIEFGDVSAALIALLTQCPPPPSQPLYVMKCPMWEKSPAQWIQAGKDVQNPFMGQAMLSCGEVVRSVEAGRQ
jgi:membrane fusion protein, copper/silver efflux system